MNIKMTMTYILEIQVLTWDRHAASTALPPCSRIARPILEHSVLSDTTAPDAPTYNRNISEQF
jgi:hypothetical protein